MTAVHHPPPPPPKNPETKGSTMSCLNIGTLDGFLTQRVLGTVMGHISPNHG